MKGKGTAEKENKNQELEKENYKAGIKCGFKILG